MFYLHLGSRFCQLHPYFLQKGPHCHLNCRETVSEVNSFQTPAGSQLLSSADYALAYYSATGARGTGAGAIGAGCAGGIGGSGPDWAGGQGGTYVSCS